MSEPLGDPWGHRRNCLLSYVLYFVGTGGGSARPFQSSALGVQGLLEFPWSSSFTFQLLPPSHRAQMCIYREEGIVLWSMLFSQLSQPSSWDAFTLRVHPQPIVVLTVGSGRPTAGFSSESLIGDGLWWPQRLMLPPGRWLSYPLFPFHPFTQERPRGFCTWARYKTPRAWGPLGFPRLFWVDVGNPVIFIQKMTVLAAVMIDLCSMFLFWACFCETVSGWYWTCSPHDHLGSGSSRCGLPFCTRPCNWLSAALWPNVVGGSWGCATWSSVRRHWDLGMGWWYVGGGGGLPV